MGYHTKDALSPGSFIKFRYTGQTKQGGLHLQKWIIEQRMSKPKVHGQWYASLSPRHRMYVDELAPLGEHATPTLGKMPSTLLLPNRVRRELEAIKKRNEADKGDGSFTPGIINYWNHSKYADGFIVSNGVEPFHCTEIAPCVFADPHLRALPKEQFLAHVRKHAATYKPRDYKTAPEKIAAARRQFMWQEMAQVLEQETDSLAPFKQPGAYLHGPQTGVYLLVGDPRMAQSRSFTPFFVRTKASHDEKIVRDVVAVLKRFEYPSFYHAIAVAEPVLDLVKDPVTLEARLS